MELLQSFAGGICFAIGATFGAFVSIWICAKLSFAQTQEIAKELRATHQRVENRLGAQVETMVECLEAIKEMKEKR